MSRIALPAWARPRDMADLVRLALPVAASRATFMLMSLTDAVVLARHAPGQLPQVLNGWLVVSIVLGFGMGLMQGVQVLAAELNGSGRGAETGRIFRRGLWVAAAYGLAGTVLAVLVARPVMALFGFDPAMEDGTIASTRILAYGVVGHMGAMCCSFYLEGLRKPNLVTAISAGGVVFNLVFDLIAVPVYGAEGVVWATTATRYAMMAAMLVAIAATTPGFGKAPAGPAGEGRRQNLLGAGAGIANIAEWGSFNLTFIIASKVSLDAGTTYGLTVQLMGVLFMIYVGIGTATSVRVAEHFGRQDWRGVQDASRLGVLCAVVLGLAMSVLLWLLREPVATFALNGSDAASDGARLVGLLAQLVTLAAVVSVFDGLQAVGSMGLRAQNSVWTPTIVHVGSYVVVMAPLCWWLALPLGWGVWGVMAGVAAASVAAGVAQVVLLDMRAARGVAKNTSRAATV